MPDFIPISCCCIPLNLLPICPPDTALNKALIPPSASIAARRTFLSLVIKSSIGVAALSAFSFGSVSTPGSFGPAFAPFAFPTFHAWAAAP